jgi:hypothetical protein
MENSENQNSITIYDDALIEAAANAEKRIEAVKKIKAISLRVTNPQDWVDEGGKPYLQVSGGQKVARVFGISWRIDQPIFIIDEDGHFRYEYKGYFSMGNIEIEVIGIRSSKDPFFRGSKENPKPPSEIDKGNVQKSALTNCVGNGITSLLGLKNLTWEDLTDAGISRDKTNSVSFSKKEMTEESKGQRDEIQKMLNEMFNNDPAKVSEALEKITSFPGKDGKTVKGKSRIEDLSEKAIGPNYGKVKKLYDEWSAKHGQPSDSQPNN